MVKQPSPPGRPGLYDLQGYIRKLVPFASTFITGQRSGRGQWLTATFAGANTNTTFTLALGHVPGGFVEYNKTVGGTVFAPSTAAWTANSITLQATVAGTYLLWVS